MTLSTTDKNPLLVIGFIAVDISMGDHYDIRDHHIDFGGGAGNVAVLSRRLGTNTHLLTAFGSDNYSKEYQTYLEKSGVDLSKSVSSNGPLTQCRMWPKTGKYDWNIGVGKDLTKAALKDLKNDVYSWIHLSHATTDISYWVGNTRISHRKSFNPGHGLRLKTVPINYCFDFPWDLIFLNQYEMQYLCQETGTSKEDLFQKSPVRNAIITNGSDDVEIWHMNSWTKAPVFPAQLKDPRGGGDGLISGTIYGLINKHSFMDSVKIGLSTAAYVVESPDCQPNISQKDVLTRAQVYERKTFE